MTVHPGKNGHSSSRLMSQAKTEERKMIMVPPSFLKECHNCLSITTSSHQ